MAADIRLFASLSPLFKVDQFCEIHVECKLLAVHTCVGTIHGVDADLDADHIAVNLLPAVPASPTSAEAGVTL